MHFSPRATCRLESYEENNHTKRIVGLTAVLVTATQLSPTPADTGRVFDALIAISRQVQGPVPDGTESVVRLRRRDESRVVHVDERFRFGPHGGIDRQRHRGLHVANTFTPATTTTSTTASTTTAVPTTAVPTTAVPTTTAAAHGVRTAPTFTGQMYSAARLVTAADGWGVLRGCGVVGGGCGVADRTHDERACCSGPEEGAAAVYAAERRRRRRSGRSGATTFAVTPCRSNDQRVPSRRTRLSRAPGTC